MGLIVRTAGVGKSAEALQWDLSFRLEALGSDSESRGKPSGAVPDPPEQRHCPRLP